MGEQGRGARRRPPPCAGAAGGSLSAAGFGQITSFVGPCVMENQGKAGSPPSHLHNARGRGLHPPPGGTVGHPPARPRIPPGRLLRTAKVLCRRRAQQKGDAGTKLVHVLPFPEQGSALFCQTRGNPGSAHRASRSASSKAATRFLMTAGGLINVPCSAWHRLAP